MTAANAVSPATPLLASVLDKLGREIVAGTLPEGYIFTLQAIGERFDISRTVAREAMRALEQLGLVSSSRRVGITVRSSDSWAVFDPTVITWRLQDDNERPRQLRSLTEVRIAVEPIAAHNAAYNATPEQREELIALAAEMRKLGESTFGASPEFLQADMRFHTILLEASGNEMFRALSSPLLKALYGRTEFGLQPESPSEKALAAHEEVAQAIAEGDGTRAEEAARVLIAEVRASLSSKEPA